MVRVSKISFTHFYISLVQDSIDRYVERKKKLLFSIEMTILSIFLSKKTHDPLGIMVLSNSYHLILIP